MRPGPGYRLAPPPLEVEPELSEEVSVLCPNLSGEVTPLALAACALLAACRPASLIRSLSLSRLSFTCPPRAASATLPFVHLLKAVFGYVRSHSAHRRLSQRPEEAWVSVAIGG